MPFAQSPWVKEQCGRSQIPGVWFVGGPPNEPTSGWVKCTLTTATFLVVEAVDVIASPAFGDPNTPKGLLAAIDDAWPCLTTVEVTFDGQTMVNPTAYVATTPAVMLPAGNMFTDPADPMDGNGGPVLARGRYYQFVTRPLGRGTHTLHVHYEWAPDWFGTHDRDHTIIAK